MLLPDWKEAEHGKKPNQKVKPYVVLQYLLKNTDEDHLQTAPDIVAFLEEDCGIDAERRSIYKDIEEINKVALMFQEGCTIDDAADMLENDDIEDLLDSGLIEEDDLYLYGPFTSNDINDIKLFNSSTWTDVTGRRYKLTRKKKKVELKNADGEVIKDADGKAKTTTIEVDRAGATLASIIGDTVSPIISNIECDLTYDYIANEILQNRRLKSRDLLMASSAIALEVLDMDPPEDKEKRESYNSAKKTCSWIGYYAAEALGYRKSELKERYGNTRPTDRNFFEEIASTSEQLTEERAAYLDKYFKKTFTKMDEHIHEVLNRLVEINEENPMTGEEWD